MVTLVFFSKNTYGTKPTFKMVAYGYLSKVNLIIRIFKTALAIMGEKMRFVLQIKALQALHDAPPMR